MGARKLLCALLLSLLIFHTDLSLAYRGDDPDSPTIHHHRSELFTEVEECIKEFMNGLLGDTDLLRHVVDWGMIRKGLLTSREQEHPDFFLEHMTKNDLKNAVIKAVREEKLGRFDPQLEGNTWEQSLEKMGKTLDIRMVHEKAKVKLPYVKDIVYVQKQLGKWKVTWWEAFADLDFVPTSGIADQFEPVDMDETPGGANQEPLRPVYKGKRYTAPPPRRDELFEVDGSDTLDFQIE